MISLKPMLGISYGLVVFIFLTFEFINERHFVLPSSLKFL